MPTRLMDSIDKIRQTVDHIKIEDLGGGAALVAAFNADKRVELAEKRQYLPGEAIPPPEVDDGGNVTSASVVVSLQQGDHLPSITNEMTSGDHMWSVRQEWAHRAELNVLQTINDVVRECQEVLHRPLMSRRSIGGSSSSAESSSSPSTRRRSNPRDCFNGDDGLASPAQASERQPMHTLADDQAPAAVEPQTSNQRKQLCVAWIDVQSNDTARLVALCDMLNLHSSTIGNIIGRYDPVDKIEHYRSLGYFFINLTVPATFDKNDAAKPPPAGVVSCVVFSKLIITIHRNPFPGLAETIREARLRFACRLRREALEEMELQVSLDDARSVISRPDRIYNEMRVGWVLTHLLARSVLSSIADPTVLLREINELDSLILLQIHEEGSGVEPRLLLQRIHAASRHLARDKDIVLSKKQLVNELLLTPACRAMFHASDAAALNQALAHASHTYSRLELGQTALNNAKVNLTSCASLHLGRSSQHESTRIKVITFVAVAGLAPFLLTATMSMNLSVPFMQANGFRKFVSFYVIVAVVAAWIAVWGIVMFKGRIREFCFGTKTKR